MALSKVLEVECLLCKEIINCQQNDTSALVDHVNLKHPDIEIANLPKELNPKSNVTSSGQAKKIGKYLRKTMEENQSVHDLDGSGVPNYTENEQLKKRKTLKNDTKRRRFYKTSVETWKPGRDKILCPKCDAIVRPIIRRSADRENLHCSICGYYFGSYDYQNQKMKLPKESQKAKSDSLEATPPPLEMTPPPPPNNITEKSEEN